MGNRKLPIYLLSTCSSQNDDSTNCRIASYILENIESVKGMTIVELAQCCYVSNSSISRFCKDIGLHDFVELKDLLQSTELSYMLLSQKESIEERGIEFASIVQDGISTVVRSLDYKAIAELVKDLLTYDRIAAFGLLKAETIAMNFQQDMLMLGKMVTTKVNFSQQMEFMKRADERDLIILFSPRGSYFEHYGHFSFKENHKPKIYMVTANVKMVDDSFADKVIGFQKGTYPISSPYLFQIIEGIIAQNVAYELQQKETAISL